MANSTLKNYLDAGMQFTEMSKKQAEAFVSNLVQSGDVRRKDAEQMVESVIRRSRETTERIAAMVQAEVAKQLKALSARFDEVEQRVEAMTSSVMGGASTTSTAKRTGAKKSTAKKSSAKKSSAKKSTAKKSTAKKSTAKKKSGTKQAAARKPSSAKQSAGAAVGSSGVRKVSTSRPT
jgi:polyhydroxyalkanoate synthesis regulator phasin